MCLAVVLITLINFSACDGAVTLRSVLQHAEAADAHLLHLEVPQLLGCACGIPRVGDKRFSLSTTNRIMQNLHVQESNQNVQIPIWVR